MKIATKRFFTATLLLLCLTLSTVYGAYQLADDATLVAWIAKRLEEISGTRISYGNDATISRTLSPTLTVSKLSIADATNRYEFDTNSLQVEINLIRLLVRQLDIARLVLGETSIHIRNGDTDGLDRRTIHGLPTLPLSPVLHDLRIAGLSIRLNNNTYNLPAGHISELTLRQEDGGKRTTLSARLAVLGKTTAITASVQDIQHSMRTRLLPFSLAAAGVINLSVDGRIDFNPPIASVDAVARGHMTDLKPIPVGVEDFVLPGKLTATARITGPVNRPAIEDLSATWHGPDRSTADLSGRIANIIDQTGVELDLSGRIGKSPWLSPVLPESLDALSSADLKAHIAGRYRHLVVYPFSLHVNTSAKLDMALDGRFDLQPGPAGLGPENIKLKLDFTAPATRAARALLFEQVPEFGPITGTADIRSSSGDPAVDNIVIQTRDAQGIEVDLSGGIGRFPLDPDKQNRSYDLDVAMRAGRASVMAERLGMDLPIAGMLDLRYRIEGDTQALQLKKIALSIAEKNTFSLTASGDLSFGAWQQTDPLKTVDLKLRAASQTAQPLSLLTGQSLPRLGGFDAHAHLHTVAGRHRLDAIRIEAHKNAPLKTVLTGAAGHVTIFPQPAINGIKLMALATAADTARLNDVFGLQKKIPAIGPLTASARISGTDRQLVITDVAVAAGRKDILLIDVTGRLGSLGPANRWHPQDTDLRIRAQSTSSSSLAKTLGYHVPELGPMAARANIHDKDRSLGLESAQILVGEAGDPVVEANGFIDDLFGDGAVQWDVRLNLDGHAFATFADKHKLPDLGQLVGNMAVSNRDGTLGIDVLTLRSTRTQLLSLEINGSFDDFHDPDTLILNSQITARDLQLIGALFDREWPALGPVTLNGEAKKAARGVDFNLALTAGETRVHAAVNGFFAVKPLQLTGTVTAQNFFLPDFESRMARKARDKKPAKAFVFPRTPLDFGWLKKADLDLDVDIESFDRQRSNIDSARFTLALKDGRLAISPAHLTYPQGTLRLDFEIDARNPLQLRARAFGEGINPWLAMDMQQSKTGDQFDADLDIDINMASSGKSMHDLAANLEGDIYLTIQNGKISRTLTDLIFVDLVGWTVGKAKGEKYVDVTCGVADYTINQGVVSTNAFLIDTKSITVTGQGTIDLGNEQVDYVFLPKKKSRLIHKADPVNLKGPLNAPKVTVIPWKSAATTYGTLLFAPYVFVGLTAVDYLTGMLNFRSTESPCLQYEKIRKQRRQESLPPGNPQHRRHP